MFHSELCDTLVQKLLFKRIPRGWRYQLCIQEPAFAMLNTCKKILAIEKQSLKLPTQYRLKQELIQKPVLAVISVEPTTNVQSDMKVTIKDEEMEEERIETPVNCNICKQVNCKISTNDVWAHSVGKIRRMFVKNVDCIINQSHSTHIWVDIKKFVKRNHVYLGFLHFWSYTQ